MSDEKAPVGSVLWFDLTVDNAENVRDFYSEVIGWKPEEVSMGSYSDYNMTSPETGDPMTGVCHARGANKDLPPYWLLYVTVEDIEASIRAVEGNNGRLVQPIKEMGGHGRYCVIQDPAGAYLALFEQE